MSDTGVNLISINDLEQDAVLFDTTVPSEKMKDFEDILELLVGQEDAKRVVIDIIEQVTAGVLLRKEHQPIATMLMSGPSGVGKTQLARYLQDILNKLNKTDHEIIKINCADFQDAQGFGLSRLIGASAGYIGSDLKPKFHPDNIQGKGRVILFDEIEKAGNPLRNILLSIMDDGTLDVNYTDSRDNFEDVSVDFPEESQEEQSSITTFFEDTVIILTSNLGNRQISENKSTMGFGATVGDQKKTNTEKSKIIMEEIEKSFKMELQGRLNFIVPFHHLTEEQISVIATYKLQQISDHLMKKRGEKFVVRFKDSIIHFIVSEISQSGKLEKYGCRALENYITQYVVPKLARVLNHPDTTEATPLYVDVQNDEIVIRRAPVLLQNLQKDVWAQSWVILSGE